MERSIWAGLVLRLFQRRIKNAIKESLSWRKLYSKGVVAKPPKLLRFLPFRKYHRVRLAGPAKYWLWCDLQRLTHPNGPMTETLECLRLSQGCESTDILPGLVMKAIQFVFEILEYYPNTVCYFFNYLVGVFDSIDQSGNLATADFGIF